ncbi:MAG: SMP-30/gluconolactonase/LRE family protein [Chloroflexi bacterium]|nr:SMP-30/gluconolactonase/LRE family protein [Chloroflexota bacterium]MXX50425.1 SMP-30/gluconolactonase/LRE family protein [Chloroflexota bacterium]MXX83661.1 SMP-30/gluconolactonase/LRE family protein [Chloroflexota bacterium]MYA93144.1 SMP-30/gluconolactonase/LRE family protein [Chloroflexota bacterium]MYD38895.1 SMP-30/gluconolactonase/LRE family protein [Chloroflexota bacterium]
MPSITVEAHDDRFTDLLQPTAQLETVAGGLRFLEGPVWHPTEQHLRFSDILANCTWQWSASAGLSLYRGNSHMANGNTYDRQGRLLSCHHASSRVTRMDGEQMTVLAAQYQGAQLNSPNDLVVKRDGSVYFTDPPYGREPKVGIPRPCDLDFNGVYRWRETDAALTLLTTELDRPNGLCFSADESLLYINDSPRFRILVFDVRADGSLAGGRLFAETVGDEDGVPDGMKIDSQGNVWCVAQGGLHVFAADGSLLGRLLLPERITNFAFGDEDLRGLYITGITTLYRLRVRVRGTSLF